MKFRRKLTYQHFKEYFGNHMLNKDKHAFEKSMMQDVFDSEAFDGLSKLKEGEWEQDIAELQQGIAKRTRTNRRIIPVWYKYAAGVVILTGVGLSLFIITRQLEEQGLTRGKMARESEQKETGTPASEEKREKKSALDLTTEEVKEAQPEKIVSAEPSDKVERRRERTSPVEHKSADKQDMAALTELTGKQEKSERDAQYDMEEVEELASEPITVTDTTVDIAAIHAEDTEEIIGNAVQGRVAGVSIRAKKVEKEELTGKGTLVKTVKGRVLGSDQMPLPGVVVTVEGSELGTATDMDGNFTLQIPEDIEVKNLVASYIGFESQTIPIEDTSMMIVMEEELLALEEVVVTGYGTTQKEAVTGAVTRIDMDKEPAYQPVTVKAKPIYPEGIKTYKQYVIEHLDYSQFSEFPGSHKIKFTFTVDSDGSLSGFQFIQSPSPVFNDEIQRVMLEGGKWAPTTIDGQPVSSTLKLTLKIEVE